jgi:hypothetical protein
MLLAVLATDVTVDDRYPNALQASNQTNKQGESLVGH